jgi:hypothetical protein
MKGNDNADHYAGQGVDVAEHDSPSEQDLARYKEARGWYSWLSVLAGNWPQDTQLHSKAEDEAPPPPDTAEADEDPFGYGGMGIDNEEVPPPVGQHVGMAPRQVEEEGVEEVLAEVPRQFGHCVHLESPHELFEDSGRLKCRKCPGSSKLSSAAGSIKAFARTSCKGDPRANAGAHHDLWRTGPYLWCTICGSFSSGQRVARGINEDCVGKRGMSAKGSGVTKRLSEGCHPATGRRIGVAARSLQFSR